MTPVLFPELAEPEVAPATAPVPPAQAAARGPGREPVCEPVCESGRRPGRARSTGAGLQEGATWCDWLAAPYRGCGAGRDAGWGALHYDGDRRFDSGRPHECSSASRVEGFVGALRRDLRNRVRPGAHIAFGATTDPYPLLEARERVMFRALTALLDASGLRISVTTRSTLVARDAKLLGLLAQRHAVHVNVVVATPDPRLAHFLEPGAPAPQERWDALHVLRRHGVDAGAFLSPLLPGVTDADTDLDALCADASEAGARWLGARLVVPDEAACVRLLRELRRAYPRVAARFAWWTRYADGSPGSGTERRPSRRRNAPTRGPSTRDSRAETGRQRPRSGSAGADTLGRVHQLATRYGLAVRPGLLLPAPQRSRQATFAFPAPAASS